MIKEYTVQQLLALPMEPNDSGASTVGGYLVALVHAVWNEEEGFSGKRPFGNSGWQQDLWKPFITHDVVTGELDEDGYVKYLDDFAFETQMSRIFAHLNSLDWLATREYREPEDWYVVYLDLNGNGNPVISDSFTDGFTEKEAKAKVEDRNKTAYSGVWTAVHIPK
jgi:hypothetical protein